MISAQSAVNVLNRINRCVEFIAHRSVLLLLHANFIVFIIVVFKLILAILILLSRFFGSS